MPFQYSPTDSLINYLAMGFSQTITASFELVWQRWLHNLRLRELSDQGALSMDQPVCKERKKAFCTHNRKGLSYIII